MLDRRLFHVLPALRLPMPKWGRALPAVLALCLCLGAGLLAFAAVAPAAHAATPGSIAGTVTKPGGAGLSGIDVTAMTSDGHGGWSAVTDVSTAGDGTYELSGLAAPGTYRVAFSDPSGTYITQYYDNKPDVASATDVTMAAGASRNDIDAVLIGSGNITGSVAKAGGGGLGGIDVTVFQPDGSGGWIVDAAAETYTKGDGSYEIDDLAEGTYRIGFSDQFGTYLTQYYAGQSSVATASDVSVTAGDTTTDINAVMAVSGEITGTVIKAGGSGIEGIDVTAFQADGHGGWSYVNGTFTEAGGTFDINGLDTGNYRLEFTDDFFGLYTTQYYDNKPDVASATDVAVTAGAITSNVNATLAGTAPVPAVTALSEHFGLAGDTMTIAGTGFTGATSVHIGTAAATQVTVSSDTRIVAHIPAGSGTLLNVTVTTPGGTSVAVAADKFTYYKVVAKLTLNLSGLTSSAIKLGKSVTTKGTLTPTSLKSSKITLTVQRKSSGTWVKVTSLSRTISSSGTYSGTYKPGKKGSYRMQATIAAKTTGTYTHPAAVSLWRAFTVK